MEGRRRKKKSNEESPKFGRTSQFPSLKRVESGAVKRARIKSSHIRHRKNTVSFFFPPGEVSTGGGEGNVNPDLMSREAFFFFSLSFFFNSVCMTEKDPHLAETKESVRERRALPFGEYR